MLPASCKCSQICKKIAYGQLQLVQCPLLMCGDIMKIFFDTANIQAITKWSAIIDGVTTNPSHLYKEGGNPVAVVKKICKILPKGEISVEITKTKPEDVYKQAKAIAALSKNVIVKIPCHADYYEVIKKLVSEGIAINITLLFTLVQALYMCKLGVRYISPFIGRWDDIDVDGVELIPQLRCMIDHYNYSTQILAASLRSVRHLHDVILAGADVATIPVDIFEKSVKHPLTDRGMELFLADWKKLASTQFP